MKKLIVIVALALSGPVFLSAGSYSLNQITSGSQSGQPTIPSAASVVQWVGLIGYGGFALAYGPLGTATTSGTPYLSGSAAAGTYNVQLIVSGAGEAHVSITW